jgi:hypothetical protein
MRCVGVLEVAGVDRTAPDSRAVRCMGASSAPGSGQVIEAAGKRLFCRLPAPLQLRLRERLTAAGQGVFR